MTDLLLIGCGNMGHAMLTGWLNMAQPPRVTVVEPADALRERAAASGAAALASAADLPAGYAPDLVVLAIKPQTMARALPDYARFAGACFLSVAAGTTMATLTAGLGGGGGAEPAVIRCMPNTPAAIGKGVFGLYANAAVTAKQKALARRLLETSGTVLDVTGEEDIDRITAISGSGPAYLFHMIEALAEAARRIGLPEETAVAAARGTIFGAAALAEQSDDDAATLRRNVTSPNGTTAAALEVLMEESGGLTPLMTRAAEAAFRRAGELAREG